MKTQDCDLEIIKRPSDVRMGTCTVKTNILEPRIYTFKIYTVDVFSLHIFLPGMKESMDGVFCEKYV